MPQNWALLAEGITNWNAHNSEYRLNRRYPRRSFDR
jgi:hypothetical protein